MYCRRLILHSSVYDEVLEKLKKAYGSIMTRRGDPLDDGTLYGPMHSQVGVAGYKQTIEEAKKLGGTCNYILHQLGNISSRTITEVKQWGDWFPLGWMGDCSSVVSPRQKFIALFVHSAFKVRYQNTINSDDNWQSNHQQN